MTNIMNPNEEHIGPYVVISRLSANQTGEMYQALDPQLNRYVVIKVLSEELSRQPDIGPRLKEYFRLINALQHECFVRILEISPGQLGVEKPYIVQEYVDGPTLRELTQGAAHPPLTSLIEFMIQACQGLEYATQHNLVHGNICPAHMMIAPNGLIKMVDFGFSQLLTQALPTAARKDVELSIYSPPEFRHGHLDLRSDIYSLGITFLHLCTGREPTGTMMDFQQHTAPLPDKLTRTLQRMTQRDPDQRYQSYQRLLAELDAARLLAMSREGFYQFDDPTSRPPSAPSVDTAPDVGAEDFRAPSTSSNIDNALPQDSPYYAQQKSSPAIPSMNESFAEIALDMDNRPDLGSSIQTEYNPGYVNANNPLYSAAEEAGYNPQRALQVNMDDVATASRRGTLAGTLFIFGFAFLFVAMMIMFVLNRPNPEEGGEAKKGLVNRFLTETVPGWFAGEKSELEVEMELRAITRERMQYVFTAVENYFIKYKKYPNSLQDLIEKENIAEDQIKDGWGTLLDYRRSDRRIISAGADKSYNTTDDFVLLNGRFTAEPPKLDMEIVREENM
ncbi:serine/threonine protein kinase [Candidatus Sumerlaeota bacterium]|nr:serine/threonine protein kinase [Candidatus Sumerlaeota bacterium]